MAATSYALIYDVTAIVLTPSTALRRIVKPDTDSQLTDPNGPCKINLGEAKILIPVLAYQALADEAAAVSYVLAHL